MKICRGYFVDISILEEAPLCHVSRGTSPGGGDYFRLPYEELPQSGREVYRVYLNSTLLYRSNKNDISTPPTPAAITSPMVTVRQRNHQASGTW